MHRFALALLAAAALFAGPAHAQQGRGFNPTGPGSGVAVWGILGSWGDGFGIGGRYVMPLIPEGVLKGSGTSIRKDSIELEVGLDYVHYAWDYWGYDWSWNVLRPAVGGKWSIWLTDEFAVYPKLELGFDIAWYSSSDWGPYLEPESHTGIYFDAAAGVLYRIGSNLDLRAELGIDGLRAGVAFNF